MAIELKDRSIRVNSFSPGPIDTPIYDTMVYDQTAREETKNYLAPSALLGRLGRDDEMASAVLFLIADGGITLA